MIQREIVAFIHSRRLPLHSERACQLALADELKHSGFVFEREVRLGGRDIIDFMIGNVGVEMKISGQRREIYRQCERYCEHERVGALILATNAAMGMPPEINGKPIMIAHLGRAWL